MSLLSIMIIKHTLLRLCLDFTEHDEKHVGEWHQHCKFNKITNAMLLMATISERFVPSNHKQMRLQLQCKVRVVRDTSRQASAEIVTEYWSTNQKRVQLDEVQKRMKKYTKRYQTRARTQAHRGHQPWYTC